jgi:acetamidase/formamidase
MSRITLRSFRVANRVKKLGTDTHLFARSHGSTRPLIDALRLGCADMVDWLMKDYGFDRYEAVELLGQTAHLYIANVVDPQFSVACALNKKYLPK